MRPNNRMLGTRIDLSAIVIAVAAAIMLLAIMACCEGHYWVRLRVPDRAAKTSFRRSVSEGYFWYLVFPGSIRELEKRLGPAMPKPDEMK
jgi:hypothetical protein